MLRRSDNLLLAPILILMVLLGAGHCYATTMPLVSQWTEHGTVLHKGSNGSWDDTDVRMGCVIAFRDSVFLYYVGADHQRPDGDAGNMSIGLAKSVDGVNFTKYSANPIITFQPTGDAEECAEFPVAAVDDGGTIWMYWGGNTSIGGSLVRCDIYLSTSTDGVHFSGGNKVIDYSNIGTGGGDEIWPIGLLHAQGGTATGTGNWHLWICGDRSPTAYSVKLAVSNNGTSWSEQNESPVLTDYLWQEGICPILHEDNSITIFDFCGCAVSAGREIRIRETQLDALHSYTGILDSFADDPWWPGTVGVIADTSAGLWRLYWPNRSSDIGGVINMKTAPLDFSGNYAPTAAFSADPTSGAAPLVVDFDASASSDPNEDDLTYAWTVKQGTSVVATGSGLTWQYNFTTSANYDVFLVVTDDGDPALSDTASVSIQVLDQLPPTASFTADPSSGTFPFPLQVNFDASASDDPDGSIVSYQWDFGDGSDSTLAGPVVSHVYASPGGGAIGVTLIVTDDDGATDDASASLNLQQEGGGGDVEVTDLSRANYQVSELEEGDQYYVDRTYQLVGIPTGYEDLLWIKTANDDKSNSSQDFLTFTVNVDVTAYVAYDHRASSPPDWIVDHYTQTGEGIEVSDVSASPMNIWARDYSAGQVTMGGNMAAGASGAGSMYAIFLRGQAPPADSVSPQISAVKALDITSTSATIRWTTDEAADSQVEYGLTEDYGSVSTKYSDMVIQHNVPLVDLSVNTLYHYRVRSADASGNVAYSDDHTFYTAASGDIVPPQITDLTVADITSSGAAVSWSTDEPADSRVEYGLSPGSYSWSVTDSTLSLTHNLQLTGLASSTIYHYQVVSSDAAGNSASSDDDLFETLEEGDSEPPQISAIEVSDVTSAEATITWQTDEPADSRVEYGLAADVYDWFVADTALAQSHSLVISGLDPGTQYHYRVRSQDAAQNANTSADSTFLTAQDIPGTPGKPIWVDD